MGIGLLHLHAMLKSRYRAAQTGGSADDVEAAFYEALQAGDLVQMMACWADEDDIVCVHPGGPRLVGAAAIRAAFEAMFSHGSVRAYPERLRQAPHSLPVRRLDDTRASRNPDLVWRPDANLNRNPS